MAMTAQYFQDQVPLLTGNDQIGAKVLVWLNRACQELGCKVLWRRQLRSASVGGFNSSATVLSQWVSMTDLAVSDFMQMHHVEFGTTVPLIRQEAQDFYANLQGVAANYTGATVDRYCIPAWTTSGNATTQYLAPYMAIQPLGSTATNAFTAYYQAAPAKVTTSNDTNWMMDKYAHVLLARVMCYACLYLRDPQGYLAWMSRYENGVKDMILTETTSVAGNTGRRGISPEHVFHGGV